MNRRLRVLVLAEAANPDLASVPLVGWSLTRALAEVADVHLLTQIRNREAILGAGLREGVDFTPIDSEAVAAPLYHLRRILGGRGNRGWTIGTAMNTFSNYFYEAVVWRRFGERIRSGAFDVVHRVTPLSPTVPSPIAGRVRAAGVPFVLGPLNGGLPWPREFDAARRAEFEWLSYVRPLYRLLPGFAATRENASSILVGSRATLAQMPRRYRKKCVYLPENGVDPTRFCRVRTREREGPLRLVFVGRLVPYKGPDMALRAALPVLKRGEAEFVVVGEGPLQPSLEALVEREGVGDRVRFTGWLEHRRVQEELVDADLLVFPSIREFGGGVVLEAMVLGVVPVIVDYGGPAELVTADTGVTVPLGSREAIVETIRGKLLDLDANRRTIEEMSLRARARIRERFTWASKAREILGVYDRVLAEASSRSGAGGPLAGRPGVAERRIG